MCAVRPWICFFCQSHVPRVSYPRREVLHAGHVVPRELWSLLAQCEGPSSTVEGHRTVSRARRTGVDCGLPLVDPSEPLTCTLFRLPPAIPQMAMPAFYFFSQSDFYQGSLSHDP